MQTTRVPLWILAGDIISSHYQICDLNTRTKLKDLIEFNEAKKYFIQEHFTSTYKTRFQGSIVCPDSALIMVY